MERVSVSIRADPVNSFAARRGLRAIPSPALFSKPKLCREGVHVVGVAPESRVSVPFRDETLNVFVPG